MKEICHSLAYWRLLEFSIIDFNFESFEKTFSIRLKTFPMLIRNTYTVHGTKEHVAVRGKVAMKMAENGTAIKIKGEFRRFLST